MRQHTDQLADVLTGSFTRRLYMNVFHGSDRVQENLEVEQWSFDQDLSRDVASSGSGTIVYPSLAGESLIPSGTKGVLSPFRARLEPVMEITAGGFLERVSLGIFREVKVPEARDYTATLNGEQVVTASRVGVTFLSLEDDVRRRGLRRPEQPPALGSAYDEIRRLTGMPVEMTLPDVAIPDGTTWEAKNGGRLDAVQKLASFIGGVAVVNSRGAWEVIPDAVGDPVGTLRLGERGTIIDVGNEVDTDGIYNCVVGTFEDENRNAIYATAEVTSGDLATTGLYGETTRYYSSPLVKTQEQADAAVASILALSTGSQQYDVPIQCHVNPLVELGDVLRVVDDSSGAEKTLLVGRLVKASLSGGAYMNATLRVHRSL